MRKVLLILGILLCSAGISLAANPPAKAPHHPSTAAKSAPAVHPEKHAVGNITALQQADPAQGTKAKLTLTDLQGKSETFIIATATRIKSGDKVLSASDLKAGEKVSVMYKALQGGEKEALAIRVVK